MYITAAADLLGSISMPDLGPALVIVAIGALILATSLGIAVIIAARQGRTNVTVSINLGTSRRRPP